MRPMLSWQLTPMDRRFEMMHRVIATIEKEKLLKWVYVISRKSELATGVAPLVKQQVRVDDSIIASNPGNEHKKKRLLPIHPKSRPHHKYQAYIFNQLDAAIDSLHPRKKLGPLALESTSSPNGVHEGLKDDRSITSIARPKPVFTRPLVAMMIHVVDHHGKSFRRSAQSRK